MDLKLDTMAIIHRRKSVRKFTSEKISRETMIEIIKAGMAAPTAVNKQPWAFIPIDDRATLDLLGENLEHAKMLKMAPAAIAVIALPDESHRGREFGYWIQDCSAATENILLAVEALGLGAVWTAVYPVDERIKFVTKALGLTDEQMPFNVIALGHPDGEFEAKDKYKPEKIHWNKW